MRTRRRGRSIRRSLLGLVCTARLIQLEHAHCLYQRRGLLAHRFGRCRGLLDQRGVLLRDLIHLRERLIDLLDAGSLFVARAHDLDHDLRHALYAIHHLAHRGACFLHELVAERHLLHRAADEPLDLLRRGGRTLSERADFTRDYGEPSPLLTGARGLDSRVEREDVRLEGDTVNDADDLHDLLRGRVDRAHGVHDFRHHGAGTLRHTRCGRGQLVRLARMLGVAAHRRGELFHRCRRLLERCGLLFGARRQIEVAARDLVRCGRNRAGAVVDLSHDADEALAHRLHRVHQACAISRQSHDAHSQIAGRDAVGGFGRRRRFAAQLLEHAAGNDQRERDTQDHGERGEPDHQRAARVVQRFGADRFAVVLLALEFAQIAHILPPLRLHGAQIRAQQVIGCFTLARHRELLALGHERQGKLALLTNLFKQLAFFGRRLGELEHRRQFGARLLVGLRLLVETRRLDRDLILLIGLQEDQIAQRERAIGDGVIELISQSGFHRIDISNLSHRGLELRHTIEREYGQHDQQARNQAECDAESSRHLHVG